MRISLAISLSLFALPLWGTVIISTLPQTSGEVSADGNLEVGAGFTMPAGQSYNLTSITVVLGARSLFIVVPGSDVHTQLFGTSAGNPVGPALVTFTPPASNIALFTTAPYTLTPLSPFVLHPNTTYWIVLGDKTDFSAGGGFFWSQGGVVTGLASNAGARQGNTDPPQSVVGANVSAVAYQVDGVATAAETGAPEPATLGGVALGLFAVLTRKRLLRRSV